MSRARLLGAYVEVVLAAGDVEAARPAAVELVETASMFGTGLLVAMARRALGAVLLAEGDAAGALVELRRRVQRAQPPRRGPRGRVRSPPPG